MADIARLVIPDLFSGTVAWSGKQKNGEFYGI